MTQPTPSLGDLIQLLQNAPVPLPSAAPAGDGDPLEGVRINGRRAVPAERGTIGPIHGPSVSQVHRVTRRDIEWGQLTKELETRLGRPVAAMFELDQGATAGELTLRDPETLEYLDVDQAVIDEVVAAHKPPEPPARKALRKLNEAKTIPAQLAAVREFMEHLAEQEAKQAEVADRISTDVLS